MRILKPPPEPFWELQFECKKCLTLLLAEFKDLRYTYSGNSYGNKKYYVRCPTCRREIEVPKETLSGLTEYQVESIREL